MTQESLNKGKECVLKRLEFGNGTRQIATKTAYGEVGLLFDFEPF
jgi:hypothetical protein